MVGIFGRSRQRDAISALLLENEQLHELLAQKQEQLRELTTDLTNKLLARLDEQAQESARAVRYKQALLSAFLEREETRALLNKMLAEGDLPRGRDPSTARRGELGHAAVTRNVEPRSG